jgi:hypothetical protein
MSIYYINSNTLSTFIDSVKYRKMCFLALEVFVSGKCEKKETILFGKGGKQQLWKSQMSESEKLVKKAK